MDIFSFFKQRLGQYGLEYFNRWYSIYPAVVSDNEDPEFRGRVKIKCPAVYGTNSYNYWAESFGVPSGGTALYQIPSVGDAVWVQFQGGDVRFPIWSWGVFEGHKVPSAARVDGLKVKATVLRSSSGHTVTLDDKNGTVTVANANGDVVELSKSGVSVKSKNISLGGNVEKAVKGDTLTRLLTRLLIALETATDAAGVPLNPATITQLTAIKAELNTALSNTVTLK